MERILDQLRYSHQVYQPLILLTHSHPTTKLYPQSLRPHSSFATNVQSSHILSTSFLLYKLSLLRLSPFTSYIHSQQTLSTYSLSQILSLYQPLYYNTSASYISNHTMAPKKDQDAVAAEKIKTLCALMASATEFNPDFNVVAQEIQLAQAKNV